MTDIKNAALEGALSDIGGEEKGTLVFLEIRKKGVERGKAGSKLVYGDDLVQVLLWSGFSYKALVENSDKKLDILWGAGNLTSRLIEAAQEKGHRDIVVADASIAIQEVKDSLTKTLTDTPSDGTDEEEEPSEPVWDSVSVNGTLIKGAKLYVGKGDPEDRRAPVPGTVYIDGIKLGSKVLEPPKNGYWETNKKPKTAAKDLLRSWLPVGRYTRYSLAEGQWETMKVGDEAARAAEAAGVSIDPVALRFLFKIAL